jgi:hypothetical protein
MAIHKAKLKGKRVYIVTHEDCKPLDQAIYSNADAALEHVKAYLMSMDLRMSDVDGELAACEGCLEKFDDVFEARGIMAVCSKVMKD